MSREILRFAQNDTINGVFPQPVQAVEVSTGKDGIPTANACANGTSNRKLWEH